MGEWRNNFVARRSVDLVVRERDLEDPGRELPPSVAKSLEGDTVTVIVPPGLDLELKSTIVRDWLLKWYRQEAWDHLRSRVAEFGRVMGVHLGNLKLSNAKKRWGRLQRETVNKSKLATDHVR